MRGSKISETLIVMPAYNESENIHKIIAETRAKVPGASILVVNDGSTDATDVNAKAAGATVLNLPYNLGVGGAMRAGFIYARQFGFKNVIQLDSDGQHDPAYIGRLLAGLGEFDLVVGARFMGEGTYSVRGLRKLAMILLSKSLSSICKTNLTDTTSGFKAMGERAVELFARNYPAEYLGDTIEALLIANQNNLKIGQIPVAMRPRAGGEPSQSPIKSALYLGRAFMALLVGLTRGR